MRNLYSRYKDLSNRDAVGYFEENVIQIKDGRKNIRVYNLEVTRTQSTESQSTIVSLSKREGLAGESGLMFEYIRAVREVRPRYFVWENVPGALSSEKGEAFRQLLSEMDACGYSQSIGRAILRRTPATRACLSCRKEPVPQKYFLSPKACAGILRRAKVRGRNLPRELEKALKQVRSSG